MNTLSFRVFGTPATSGSKHPHAIYRGKKGEPRVFTGKVVAVEDCKRAKPWRVDVQWAARAAMASAGTLTLLEGPLVLHVVFVMPRPKYHYGKRGLKPSAPAFHTVKPDRCKLERLIEDALTSVVWRDDAQVVAHHAWKIYGDEPGARVMIHPATLADMPIAAMEEAAA